MRIPTLSLRWAWLPLAFQRLGLGGPLPPRLQRRWLDAVCGPMPLPHDVRAEWTMLGGRRALRVRPVDASTTTAVLWLHGGAYTTCSPITHRGLAAHLARVAGVEVFLPDYRLAPEHPFPAALDDSVDALIELTGRYEHVVVGGDSAGGGLAVAATQAVAARDLRRPDALLLIAPWVDPPERSPRKKDRVVRDRWGADSLRAYAGATDPADPRIAPLRGDLTVLPRTLIHVGSEEILRPQVERFAGLVRGAGVDVTLCVYDWMWHVAHAHAGMFREASAALDELAAFVRPEVAAP